MHNPHESKTDLGAPLDGAVMVLLVDDQAMIGEAVRRSLASEAGIDFHFCSDPQQAVAVANQIKPTVILQDLVMPGVDGLTLLAAYRGNPATRDIPIIVLSTKEEPTVKSAASPPAPTTTWSSCLTPSSWWRGSATTRVRTSPCSNATRPIGRCARASSSCWRPTWCCNG